MPGVEEEPINARGIPKPTLLLLPLADLDACRGLGARSGSPQTASGLAELVGEGFVLVLGAPVQVSLLSEMCLCAVISSGMGS